MALHSELIALQKQVNAIVEADAEYMKLKMERDILCTVINGLLPLTTRAKGSLQKTTPAPVAH